MKRFIFSFVGLCLACVLTGSGCDPSSPPTLPTPDASLSSWQSVGNGMERLAYRFATSTGAQLIVYRFEPADFIFSFAQTTSVKTVSEWLIQDLSAVFVLNGVYFHEDYLPSGYFVSQGRRVGVRRFDLEKSGVIDFTSGVHLIDTAQQRVTLSSLKEAAQSYPFLIRNGRVPIKTDSGKAARRSFIGLDRDGRIYLGILPYAQLSLFELAQRLSELPISWVDVLNLDGGPSSGLAYRSFSFPETIESYVAVPNVILVKRK